MHPAPGAVRHVCWGGGPAVLGLRRALPVGGAVVTGFQGGSLRPRRQTSVAPGPPPRRSCSSADSVAGDLEAEHPCSSRRPPAGSLALGTQRPRFKEGPPSPSAAGAPSEAAGAGGPGRLEEPCRAAPSRACSVINCRAHYLALNLPGAGPRPGSGRALSSCSRRRRQARAIINRLPPLLRGPRPCPDKGPRPALPPTLGPFPRPPPAGRMRGRSSGSWHGRQCVSV